MSRDCKVGWSGMLDNMVMNWSNFIMIGLLV